ncbi:putative DNA-binding transcriptional regulator AlpA [Paraburkholderia sp. GAS199]|uniref:helix-turn-helix transcriptional regulator n=1 Tax=Paraburkholderia sp. GAS199 TaxID=3035126 RepID=UPI003D1CB0AA
MEFLSLPAAAKHVGLSVSTVRRLHAQDGKFPKPHRHGDQETGHFRFAVADLDAWVSKTRPQGARHG